jgi:hypothetical protein
MAMQPQPTGQAAQPQDPKLQNISERLVLAAQKIIYDPNVSKQLLEIIKQGDPVQGVVHAAMVVLDQLREKVKGIPQDMAYAVAPAVVMDLFRLAEAAGVVQVKPEMVAQARQALVQAIQARAQGQGPAAQPAAQPAQPGLIGSAMQGA